MWAEGLAYLSTRSRRVSVASKDGIETRAWSLGGRAPRRLGMEWDDGPPAPESYELSPKGKSAENHTSLLNSSAWGLGAGAIGGYGASTRDAQISKSLATGSCMNAVGRGALHCTEPPTPLICMSDGSHPARRHGASAVHVYMSSGRCDRAVASEGRRRTNRSACGAPRRREVPAASGMASAGRPAGRRGSWARCDAMRIELGTGEKKKVAWLAMTGRNAIAMPAGACMRTLQGEKKGSKRGWGRALLLASMRGNACGGVAVYPSTTTSILYLLLSNPS